MQTDLGSDPERNGIDRVAYPIIRQTQKQLSTQFFEIGPLPRDTDDGAITHWGLKECLRYEFEDSRKSSETIKDGPAAWTRRRRRKPEKIAVLC